MGLFWFWSTPVSPDVSKGALLHLERQEHQPFFFFFLKTRAPAGWPLWAFALAGMMDRVQTPKALQNCSEEHASPRANCRDLLTAIFSGLTLSSYPTTACVPMLARFLGTVGVYLFDKIWENKNWWIILITQLWILPSKHLIIECSLSVLFRSAGSQTYKHMGDIRRHLVRPHHRST